MQRYHAVVWCYHGYQSYRALRGSPLNATRPTGAIYLGWALWHICFFPDAVA